MKHQHVTFSKALQKALAIAVLIAVFPGLVICSTYASLDAVLEEYESDYRWAHMIFGKHAPFEAVSWAPDLPDHMLDKSVEHEFAGHAFRSHPESMAEWGFGLAFQSVAVVGLATLNTYGLDGWTRRLRKDGRAMELLSSLWMQESKLGDYYQRIHGNFQSRQRGLYARA